MMFNFRNPLVVMAFRDGAGQISSLSLAVQELVDGKTSYEMQSVADFPITNALNDIVFETSVGSGKAVLLGSVGLVGSAGTGRIRPGQAKRSLMIFERKFGSATGERIWGQERVRTVLVTFRAVLEDG